jgi:ATP-dependent helicase HrpA
MIQVSKVPPSERYPGRPAGGRLVVIAPTRAACETIELGVGLTGVETVIEREHGPEIRRLAAEGRGFGIVAGTGTGKTLAIRPMAEEIVGTPIRVGVVNREREATPETPTWNVVIVTTGIARRWLQDDLIGPEDTLIVDEIHQTSAELELCLALGKRAGCRFIWLSATVDPSFYREYLDSAEVIESSAFDPAKAATVRVANTTNPIGFLSERFLRHVTKEKRGVAIFVPTRAETEQIAAAVGERWDRIYTEFYHGGEPISKLRPFLEGDAAHPYLLSMTAAGQSALNIQGLDTVVIEDAQFTTVVRHGKGVLTRLPLGANEILQMAGRVHGRVAGGEVWILSERQIDFDSLRPTEPNFQLAGDPERVAMTCADMGVRADDLDLPVPLDSDRVPTAPCGSRGARADRREPAHGLRSTGRGAPGGPAVGRAAGAVGGGADPDRRGVRVHRIAPPHDAGGPPDRGVHRPGQRSPHRIRALPGRAGECGSLGQVYGLPRHVFDPEALADWGEERGVLVRSIEDAALALASIYRSLDLPLPERFPPVGKRLEKSWQRLLATVMPFDLVIDEETSWGEEVRVSQTSVCGRWGAVTGEIRYFADRSGRARGSIEGTQLPFELIWDAAQAEGGEIAYDPGQRRAPLRLRSARSYAGFELDSSERAIDEFPAEHADDARRVLAGAMAAGAAYHRDVKENRATVRDLREMHRRSGGSTRPVGDAELTEHFLQRLAAVGSYSAFMETPLRLDPDEWVPAEERKRLQALPSTVTLDGDEYPLDYAVEGGEAIVRARVPDKLLWKIEEDGLPELDRPLHWTVLRGKREAIRATSLEEARELALRPRSELRTEGRLVDETRSGKGKTAERGGSRRDDRKSPRGRARKGSGGSKDSQERKGGGKPRAPKASRSESRGGRRRQKNRRKGGRD